MTGKDEHRKGGNIVFVLESYDEDLHIFECYSKLKILSKVCLKKGW